MPSPNRIQRAVWHFQTCHKDLVAEVGIDTIERILRIDQEDRLRRPTR